MQFINQKSDGSFSLNEITAKHLQKICNNKQIHVIVVVGQYRTGKSFLLNRLFGQQEFKTSSTVNSQTKGIFVASELIDDKFLLIDVEGSGATDVAIQHDINIFVLSLLISNVFMFNCVGAITTASLEQLQLVTNISDLITRGSQTFASRRPKMIYLARDFSLQLQDRNGNALSSRQYLINALSEKKEVKKSIEDMFLSSDFASLPTPHNVANLELMRPSSKLDNNFESKLSELRTMLFHRDNAGTSIDIMLTSARHAIQAINSGRVPTLSDTWTACSQLVADNAKSTMIEFLKQKLTTIPVTPEFFKHGVNFVYQSVERYSSQLLTPPCAQNVICMTRELTDIVTQASTTNSERCLHAVHHGVDQIRQLLNSSDENIIDIEAMVEEHVRFFPELITPIITVIHQHNNGSRAELTHLKKMHSEKNEKLEESLALLQQTRKTLKTNQEEHDARQSEMYLSGQKMQEEHGKAIHELAVTKQELKETRSTHHAFEEDVATELVATKRSLQQEKAQTLESTQNLVDLQHLFSCATMERDTLKDQLSTAVRSMRSRVEHIQTNMKTNEAEMVVTKDQLANTEQRLTQAKHVCGEQKEVLANVVADNKSAYLEHEKIVTSLKQSLSSKTTELAVTQTKLIHSDERWESRKRHRADSNVDHSIELEWLKNQHATDREKINEVTAHLVTVRKELLEAKVAKLLF